MKLDALVAPLRADVVSGAAVVGRTASEVVRRAVLEVPAENALAFRVMLVRLGILMLEAQPAMAPLVALISRVLNAMEGTGDLETAKGSVLHAAAAFREEVDEAAQAVAREAGALLPDEARILTVSASSTVRRALLLHGPQRSLRVTCLEGRPMCEGRHMARSLAKAGVRVRLAVDAAGGSLAGECDLILVGADSVGDRGVVNKIGTLPLACAGQRLDVPVHVLVDRTKLLPPGFPQTVEDDRPEDEVWKSPPGVRAWNRYFEIVPLNVITSFVTEEGILAPEDIHDLRARIPVPPELQQWASAEASPSSAKNSEDLEPQG